MQKEQEHTLAAIREYLTKNMPSGGKTTQSIFPNFVTYVKRVFDCCQKLFCLFSKVLVTVVKNFRNFTSYFGRY
jgi:hypothetical protein